MCARQKEWEKGGKGDGKGGETEGVKDWVSSDCVSGQLHMFLIKVLTLWEQLHTRMLVFVIRADVLWSGGSPENTASSGPARLGSARLSPQTNVAAAAARSYQPSHTHRNVPTRNTAGWQPSHTCCHISIQI